MKRFVPHYVNCTNFCSHLCKIFRLIFLHCYRIPTLDIHFHPLVWKYWTKSIYIPIPPTNPCLLLYKCMALFSFSLGKMYQLVFKDNKLSCRHPDRRHLCCAVFVLLLFSMCFVMEMWCLWLCAEIKPSFLQRIRDLLLVNMKLLPTISKEWLDCKWL